MFKLKYVIIISMMLFSSHSQAQLNETNWVFFKDSTGSGYEYFKFGQNTDLDTADGLATISDLNTLQSDADSSGVTVIFSSSGEDSTGGAGCTSLIVEGILGIDDGYKIVRESVALAGADTVTLSNEFFFVHRFYNCVFGDSLRAVGNIDCEITNKKVCRLTADKTQTLTTQFYVPGKDFVGKEYKRVVFDTWTASVLKRTTAVVNFDLFTKRPGGSWNVKSPRGLSTTGSSHGTWARPMELSPGTGIKISASTSANDTDVVGEYIIRLYQ